MGYYIDLYLRDSSKMQSRGKMVELFCANGCESFYEEETPERVAVVCLIPEYPGFYLIDFMETIKDTPHDYFADMRFGSSSNQNYYSAIFNSLFQLAEKLEFYLHDGVLNIEINKENVEQVIEYIMYEGSKRRELLGGTKKE